MIDTAGKDSEFGKKAVKGLADLDKKAQELIKRAKEQADPAERARLVEQLLVRFEGTAWAEKLK